MPKALVLLSGGLDSILAAKILMEQRVAVTGLAFKSLFFDTNKAQLAAKNLNIDLIEVDFSKKHLQMIKKPKYGYGKNMNPCIDCHGMMLKYAKYLKNKNNFDFVATGEILGQRPMSQNIESLKIIENISGLKNKILRPLSAKNLLETDMEKLKIVDREKLLNIKGRSRAVQLFLANKFKIKKYFTPAGGCLLTDPEFSKRLRMLFKNWPKCDNNDVELLKNGRIFWAISKSFRKILKILIVIGRNKEECENLKKLAKLGDLVIELKEIKGPTTLIRGYRKNKKIIKEISLYIPENLLNEINFEKKDKIDNILIKAAILTGYYSSQARGKQVKLLINSSF